MYFKIWNIKSKSKDFRFYIPPSLISLPRIFWLHIQNDKRFSPWLQIFICGLVFTYQSDKALLSTNFSFQGSSIGMMMMMASLIPSITLLLVFRTAERNEIGDYSFDDFNWYSVTCYMNSFSYCNVLVWRHNQNRHKTIFWNMMLFVNLFWLESSHSMVPMNHYILRIIKKRSKLDDR